MLWLLLQFYRLYQISIFDCILFEFLTFTNQILILCTHYHSFTRIWVRIVFVFHPVKASFFSPRTMAFFIITTVDNWLFHRTYWFPYHPWVWPLVRIAVPVGNSIPSLGLFTVYGWQGGSSTWGGLPEWECKTDHHSLLIACPHGAARERECSTNDPIYTTHPKTAPYQNMLNRYFPSQETPQRWHARPCPRDPRLGVGVVSWTRTMRHRDNNTPPKTTFYITCGTSSTSAAPEKDG